ncbi:MAG: peptidase M23 family protein [Candidatus Peregrinibacteria bacterium Greene0416_19]|nr:MAG: peptidase M23 family protein [Candidatus Peregrinibacteria bacterium Greene0416_19]
MQIQIEIPRPLLLVGLVGAFVAGVFWAGDGSFLQAQQATGDHAVREAAEERGGDDGPAHDTISQAEDGIRSIRTAQAIRVNREEILRYQLQGLESENQRLGADAPAEQVDELREATIELTSLLKDESRAERQLHIYMNQILEAEGRAVAISRSSLTALNGVVRFQWPIDPGEGLTALFEDAGYEKIFNRKHHAVDIRAAQGTVVRASAPGTVKDVVRNGKGFSNVTIDHGNGFVSLYGHLTDFTAEPGDQVEAGEQLGWSGGLPGTDGAGDSTGPHLHYAMFYKGTPVDPLEYLPQVATFEE